MTSPTLVVWARADRADAEAFSNRLHDRAGVSLHGWRGVGDPEIYLWLGAAGEADSESLEAVAAGSRLKETGIRIFVDRRTWGVGDIAAARVANFVLRELEPASLERILPQLHAQIETVAAQPDCLGCSLLAEQDAPHNLLGITGWPGEDAFNRYARWAAGHAWRDVITPVTRAVPLRQLARRLTPPN